MSLLAWINGETPLPHPSQALPEGLLAVGGDLSISRLTEAYSKGIFPWYNEGDPVLWWSPDPRMVLDVRNFCPSHSLRKRLRQIAREEQNPNSRIQVTTDTAFEEVMRACAAPRKSQAGTWISSDIQNAYTKWHRAGVVHSVETWMDGELAGGLYGVNLGGFFFGESMFARRADASKIALAYLLRFLSVRGVTHIDCQQETAHLASLGARPIPRDEFLRLLQGALERPSLEWPAGQLLHTGELARPNAKAG